MRLERKFHISIYLMLAVATIGLCSAERYFINGINFFLAPSLLLLATAYFCEGRWTLGAFASNCFGVVIAAGAALWITRSLAQPTNPLIENAPYPAAFLPFGGPILVLVMLAKLFRPKRIGDYWGLFLIGLMQMALGAILAGDSDFSLWLIAYLVTTIWALALFYFYRQSRPIESVDHAAIASLPETRLPFRWWGSWFSLRRATLVAVLAFPLFLLMPRHSNERWHLLNTSNAAGQVETGFSPRIDLTQTGKVNLSDEVAMEVRIQDMHGKPKTDVSPETRWRGSVLHNYDGGRWEKRQSGRMAGPPPGIQVPISDRPKLADASGHAYTVTYELDLYAVGGLFLADPIVPPVDDDLSICVLGENPPWLPFYSARDRLLLVPPGRALSRVLRYQQFLRPTNADASDEAAAAATNDSFIAAILRQPIPGIATWSRALVDRMVARGRLPKECVELEWNRRSGIDSIRPAYHAQVANALCEHLTSSGEFLYRLELRRSDITLDASEDFLRNVKQGFCAHFSTALTLMLRSVGIPARVVTGFRGAEYLPAEDGSEADRYVIRKNHAHSWVEMLLETPAADGPAKFEWVMLDPTPGDSAQTGDEMSWEQWWAYIRSNLRAIWTGLILDYNTDRQSDTLAAMWFGITKRPPDRSFLQGNGIALVAIPALIITSIGTWWIRRRRKLTARRAAIPPELQFYERLLDVIRRYTGLSPNPAQTPLEFAGALPRQGPAKDTLLRVATHVVGLYYRGRFGGEAIDADDQSAAERSIAELESLLRAKTP